jgi:hypothetical protein
MEEIDKLWFRLERAGNNQAIKEEDHLRAL